MKTKKSILIITIISISLLSFKGYSQTYHMSTVNVLDIDASSCSLSNPASVISTIGSINITDVNGTTLSTQVETATYNTRPKTYAVSAGRCRWIEGPNRNGTYSLGGYSINVPTTSTAYYEHIINRGTLYFETYNSSINRTVDCNTQFISATNTIINANVIEWEYSLNGSVSVVTNSQNKRDLPFDFENFDINLNNYIGQSLFFRYRLVGNVYSPFKAYTITKCSPLVLNVNTQQTNCSNTSDGHFTITFDRPLVNGERLSTLNLYHDGPDGIINTTDDVIHESLYNRTYSGTSYSWPSPLAADTYRLEYQSGGNNALVKYFPIVINSPSPVTFSAAWTDVNCFGDNTGRISISAAGGAGGYQYSINNGAVWLPFSGATSHIRSNLPAATYNVKVKDSKNCIAKQ